MSNSLRPPGLYSPWNSPGQNTGVDGLSLLQGIFPTQGSNPGSPALQADSLPAESQGNPEYDTDELLQNENRLTGTETDLWLPRGRRAGRDGLGFGISRQKLVYRGRINNKVLPYSTGKYSQNPGIDQNGKYERVCVYM